MPRMTTVQRTAIATPATGLQVYDTDTNSQWYYNGAVWVQGATTAAGSKWSNDATNTRVSLSNLSDGTTARTVGTEFVVKDNGNVGIGTTTPTDKLDVEGDISVGSSSPTANAVIRRKISTGALDIYAGTNYADGAKIAMTGENHATSNEAGRFQVIYGGGTTSSNGETNGTFQVWRRRNTGITPIIYANPSDNVGIGTTTPNEKLDIDGSISFGKSYPSLNAELKRKITNGFLDIYAGTSYLNGVKVAMSGEDVADATSAGRFQVYYGGGTAGSNGETNGTFQIMRRRNSGVSPIIYANSSDNVGIGTTSPTSKLHIVSSTAFNFTLERPGISKYSTAMYADGSFIIVDNMANSERTTITSAGDFMVNHGKKILLQSSSNHASHSISYVNSDIFKFNNGNGGSFSFGSNTIADMLNIDSVGNVGIGTTTPTEKLEVNGAIKIGTTASATPTAGTIRFNSTTNKFEGYDGTTWVAFH